jgi:hypothetical protein
MHVLSHRVKGAVDSRDGRTKVLARATRQQAEVLPSVELERLHLVYVPHKILSSDEVIMIFFLLMSCRLALPSQTPSSRRPRISESQDVLRCSCDLEAVRRVAGKDG